MRAPGFWFNPPDRPGWQGQCLRWAGAFYAHATARRIRRGKAVSVGVPTLCVGNLTAGGNGKTPLVIALATTLAARGRAVWVVTRGYGGSLAGPIRVDPTTHPADAVGDEPLQISAHCPVMMAKDRLAGAQEAVRAGAEILIFDDGFQSASVHFDRSILAVDPVLGFGNGLCIPAGPLREPVEVGIRRADAIVHIGAPDDVARLHRAWPALDSLPGHTARLDAINIGVDWSTRRVLAFAGIGRPEKFFSLLHKLGADVVETRTFGDHEPYGETVLRRLKADADRLGADLITTDKDAVRLPTSWRGIIQPLPVALVFEQPDSLGEILSAL